MCSDVMVGFSVDSALQRVVISRLYCSEIDSSCCTDFGVFGTFMCLLSLDGSWFWTSQAYLLVCQLVFLSSGDENMMILVIWVVVVIVVEFTLLVDVLWLCSMHFGGPHWSWCVLLKILLVQWYSSCYMIFGRPDGCYMLWMILAR